MDPNQHFYQADVNKDGIVNMVDFAMYAKHHKGGMYKPEPPPQPMSIKIKAIIIQLLMEQ